MAVHIGIVGAGFMGKTHSRAYGLIPSSEVVAVADVEPGRAQSLASELSCRAYSSLEGLLRDPEVDVVDLTLPTYLHAWAAVRAAESGKHVICEKPMALTLAQADKMIRAVKKNGVELMVAHVIRFWPEWDFLARKVRNKEFGKVRAIRCLRLSGAPMWGWKGWTLDPRKSGGATIDLHVHDTDFISYLLGRPRAVTSAGNIDHIHTIYDYGKNVGASAEGGWFHLSGYPFVMSYECTLDRGTFKYASDRTPTLTIFTHGSEPYSPDLMATKVNSGVNAGNISELGGYYEELNYFVGQIAEGKRPERIKPEEARQSLEICLAEIRSLKTGRRVAL